jgi:hypothetical protein
MASNNKVYAHPKKQLTESGDNTQNGKGKNLHQLFNIRRINILNIQRSRKRTNNPINKRAK